jgi:PAS domain S-box-containing protein
MSGDPDPTAHPSDPPHALAGRESLRPLSEAGLSDELIWGLVDAAPDGMVVADQEGRILLVNCQLEELFGYERSELLGKSVDELLPDQIRQGHRAHRTRYAAEPRTRPMGTGLALLGQRKDGSSFPVEVSLSPLPSASGLLVVAAVRDITARLAAEAETRRVRELLDATRDGVFIFDAETLRFSYVNQGAVEQVGYSRDELATMTPLHIAPRFTEADLRERLEPLASGLVSSTMFTTIHRRRDGLDVPVEIIVQASAPTDGSARQSFVALVRDISDRVEAEARLRDAAQEMRLLEDRERIGRDLHDSVVQRLFAAGMTLQSVASIAGDREDIADRVNNVVDELDTTIREIRTAIYKLQPPAERRPGLRSEVLTVIQQERDALATEPRIHFDGVLDVVADDIAAHLLATLREALSNVARHAAAGNVEITIQAGDDLTLRVVDDGVGIPDDLDRGNGLNNMASRAEQLGGTFRITAGPTGGCILEWKVPNRTA